MRHSFLTASVLVGALFAGACGDAGQSEPESTTQSEEIRAAAHRQHQKGPSNGGGSQGGTTGSQSGGGSQGGTTGSHSGGGSQGGTTGSHSGAGSQGGTTGSRNGGASQGGATR
jgi:hypothetical protein